MDKGKTENAHTSDEEVKFDNNPLSVRVDNQFKETFHALIKEKGLSKKQLMESMISSYAQNDIQNKREEHISFNNEINLIAASLDEILNIFKVITIKSQDTVGSLKSFYEQRIENLNTELNTLNIKFFEIQEKLSLLESSNKGYILENEKNVNKIKEFKDNEISRENEILSLNRRILELLEQINSLRNVEKKNHALEVEIEKQNRQNENLRNQYDEKKIDNDRLIKRISFLEESINDLNSMQSDEIQKIEIKLKLDAELEKKSAILEIQSKYNDLQIENIKNLGIINNKVEEISALKLMIANR